MSTVKKVCILLFLSAVSGSNLKVTFRHVKIEYISTDGLHNATAKNVRNLNDILPKNTTKAVQIEDQFIPTLYKNSVNDFDLLFILKLSKNGIEDIHAGAFGNLPKLKSIDLNLNNLTRIKSGVFNSLQIESLHLDFNRIRQIDSGAFDNMAELNYLSVGNNELTRIDPDWFRGLEKLSYLSLSYNLIEKIPENSFAHLSDASPEGIDVFLSDNRIVDISRKIFGGRNKTFNWLSLNNNEIKEWKSDFLEGIKVAHFEISNNNLTCLEGNLEKFFVTSETHIEGNPWKCECITNITDWMREKYRLSDYHDDKFAKMVDDRCHRSVSGTLVVYRSFNFI